MPRPRAGTHHNDKLHFKKGDTVIVLSGKHKGQSGKVLLALPRTSGHDDGAESSRVLAAQLRERGALY